MSLIPRQRYSGVVSIIVKAKGPSGPAKIRSEDLKHALGLVHYLRTIGYDAWIEDMNGNEIAEAVLKNAISRDPRAPIGISSDSSQAR